MTARGPLESGARMRPALLLASAGLACTLASAATAGDEKADLTAAVEAVEAQVIAWRRDIHQHPELSNRETRTAALVADHLRALGLEVRTGVAHTGVIGVLRGELAREDGGPAVALRADMDALPVTEPAGLPFASTVRARYAGQEVGVMHACGHDAHTAMLMGAASALATLRDRLAGTVTFLFQPAEEGPPPGERGGAELMIAEGALGDPAPEAIFGLHVFPEPAGTLTYREGPTMAAADNLRIVVEGRQTHGSSPWRGVDPVTVAAQIIAALQAIPSRQLDVTLAPAVVSIGSIHGGVRSNIIPDRVEMEGTVRTFDEAMRRDFHRRIATTAEKTAEAAGARATVTIEAAAPVTVNDRELARRMRATLEWAAGSGQVGEAPLRMTAEDFSQFQQRIPGLFVFLGVRAPGVAAEDAALNHSPLFHVDEDALIVGVRALAGLAWDYLHAAAEPAGG